MPPELPGVRQITVGQDGTFHLEYTTTAGDGTETYHRVPINETLDHLTPVHPAVEHDIYPNDENDLRDFVNTIVTDYVTIPDTTIHGSDCYGNTWASLSLNEERIKEIVRETVKELLEQEGFILGKIPNQPSDLPIGEQL